MCSQAAQKAVADSPATVKAAEQKLEQARAGLTAAQAALKSAQNEVKAKETLSKALA